MGFLDHSTNNIIIDAVLTNYGRQLLAENNGQFRIEYFSLGDDEIDYSLIQKYGRTIGKEKITKNTPIFEAQTKHSNSIKNRMLTLPNPSLTIMPTITLDAAQANLTNNMFTFTRQNNIYADITVRFNQRVGQNAQVANPVGLTDSTFTVFANTRFLSVSGGSRISEEPITRVAAFSVGPNLRGAGANNPFEITMSAFPLTNETFNQYAVAGSNPQHIITPVSIIGDQTGLRLDFRMKLINADG